MYWQHDQGHNNGFVIRWTDIFYSLHKASIYMHAYTLLKPIYKFTQNFIFWVKVKEITLLVLFQSTGYNIHVLYTASSVCPTEYFCRCVNTVLCCLYHKYYRKCSNIGLNSIAFWVYRAQKKCRNVICLWAEHLRWARWLKASCHVKTGGQRTGLSVHTGRVSIAYLPVCAGARG